MKTKLVLSLLGAVVAFAAVDPARAGLIDKGGFVITKPGKYKLIRNLKTKPLPGGVTSVGILIAANDVELDLAGFTIAPPAGQEGSGTGISVAGNGEGIRIQNGAIRDVLVGIEVGTTQSKAKDCLIERIQISHTAQTGIRLHGSNHIVRGCTLLQLMDSTNGITVDNPGLPLCEVSDCTISSTVFGGNGILTSSLGTLIVRRCIVHRFSNGYNVTNTCKLFDNLSSGCATAFSGNPVMVGVNN